MSKDKSYHGIFRLSIAGVVHSIFIGLFCISLYGQSNKEYNNTVSKHYTGNVNETGVNAGKSIQKQLKEINKKLDSIEKPEGWDELLMQAQVEQDKERVIQQKKDSIKKESEYKAKIVFIEKQESETFRNRMIGFLVGIVVLLLLIIIFKKISKTIMEKGSIRYLKAGLKKHKLFEVSKISKIEVFTISVATGLIISIISGSLLFKTKYYRLYKGKSVEVSKELSKFELHEFNYLAAIVCFILVSSISYFYLNNRRRL